MKKEVLWLTLISLFVAGISFVPNGPWHPSYLVIVSFFFFQTLGLISLDAIVPEEWSAQVSMVKIILRLLSSLIFITVLMYAYENLFVLVIHFVSIYLVYMVFEIGISLSNLRRNSDA